jgi:hypothetical protein
MGKKSFQNRDFFAGAQAFRSPLGMRWFYVAWEFLKKMLFSEKVTKIMNG